MSSRWNWLQRPWLLSGDERFTKECDACPKKNIGLPFLPVFQIFTDDSQADSFTTLPILVPVFISVNEIFIRVVGEYIGRIYRQLKRSTRVVVHRSVNLDD